jgi:hypothetical protein
MIAHPQRQCGNVVSNVSNQNHKMLFYKTGKEI